ncbi:hypothetical protein TSOC_007338 [Tetrabaena socialis]|uniref:C2H2-type domain-containing protein n=1 Tax=Tetrabaena socialis TaxID=47790 RepID=A0A2J8A1D0_9CHLO|nr:hypothetical protein TSOC_007338 [Tetrabaena socialis]|eukprot:PNH06336.1 hypothetical protein TSOC_007338 [Tetrabaena socialis]
MTVPSDSSKARWRKRRLDICSPGGSGQVYRGFSPLCMATNLCAECGTRLSRNEYKSHMQTVHGVATMNDSDEEHQVSADAAPADDGEAPRPQRQRRAPKPADGEAPAEGEEPAAPRERRPRGPRRGRGAAPALGPDGEPAPPGAFACGQCERTFATQQGLTRHEQAKHAEPADPNAPPAPPAPPRRRGGRPPRGGAAPVDPNDPEAVAAAAAAEAAPREAALIDIFQCKLCDQGFKWVARARMCVSARRTRPRGGRKVAAAAAERAEIAEGGDAAAPVRRGGRPPRRNAEGAGAPKAEELAALGIVAST